MKRKITVLTLSALLFAFCASAHAQQPAKVFRIGFLDSSTASGSAVLREAFRQELGKLGWIEGKEHHHRVPIYREQRRYALT